MTKQNEQIALYLAEKFRTIDDYFARKGLENLSIEEKDNLRNILGIETVSAIAGYFTYDPIKDVLVCSKNLASTGSVGSQYSGGNLPSWFDQLPIASTGAKGIAQFNANQFSVSNGIATILDAVLVPADHTHPISDIIGLQAALDSKLDKTDPQITIWNSHIADTTIHFTEDAAWTYVADKLGVTVDSVNNRLVFTNSLLSTGSIGSQYASGNLPTWFDQLPIASTAAKGIAQFSGTQFSVVNGVVTILDSVVKPDLGVPAQDGYLLSSNTNGNFSWVAPYSHPTYTARNITATAGQVISTFTSNANGHVTGIALRSLTASDIPTIAISQVSTLQTALNAKLNTSGGTVSGPLTVSSLIVNGPITQSGAAYETHAEKLYTTNDLVITRDGATTGLGVGVVSGFKILLADGTNNLIFAAGNDAVARVGWEAGSLQAIATRQDTPTSGGIAVWNSTASRFDTTLNPTVTTIKVGSATFSWDGTKIIIDQPVHVTGDFTASGRVGSQVASAIATTIWDLLPVADPIGKTVDNAITLKYGSGLKLDTSGNLIIDGDVFDLTNYYTKTISDSLYAKLTDSNIFTALTQTLKTTSNGVNLILDSASGTYRNLIYRTNGTNRWDVYAGVETETGSNIGSDFHIANYTDAGVFNGNVFTIYRSNGEVVVNQFRNAGQTRLGSIGNYYTYLYGAVAMIDYASTANNNGRFYYQNNAFHFRGGGTGETDIVGDTSLLVRSGGVEQTVWHSGNSNIKTVNWTANNLLTYAGTTYYAPATDSLAHIIQPGGASFTTASFSTGAIKITLPTTWTNTMMSMWVDIYDYNGDSVGESISIHLGGYNYSANATWYNTFAHTITNRNDKYFNVHFGHDGTNCAIYIGETTSTWDYLKVVVRNVVIGHGVDVNTYQTGWSVGIASTLGTITKTSTSGLNANTLSGYSLNTTGIGPTWGYVPFVGTDGVMEIGKYIDFHETSNDGVDYGLRLLADVGILYRKFASSTYKIWDWGNMGSGSGMNADMVDGKHATDFIYQPTVVANNTDLNTITTPGIYYNTANVSVATMTNTPAPYAFSLLVEKHAGTKQTFTTYQTDGSQRTYVRNFYSTAWSPWVVVYDANSANKSSVDWVANNVNLYGVVDLPHANNWGYIKNSLASGGLRIGTANSSGTYYDNIEVSTAGGYVKLNNNTTITGTLNTTGNITSSGDVITGTTGALVVSQTAGTDNTTGLSLYGTSASAQTYGIQFMNTSTSNYGTHGYVTGSWATYFNMNNDSTRGWIFRANSGTAVNVASISGGGDLALNGTATINGIKLEKASVSITGVGTVTALKINSSIVATGRSGSQVSDIRIKTDVREISPEDALDKVLGIKAYTYRRKDLNGMIELGNIAQEVEKIEPLLVSTIEHLGYKDFKTMSYERQSVLHGPAIRALNAKIEALEAEVKRLREGNAA